MNAVRRRCAFFSGLSVVHGRLNTTGGGRNTPRAQRARQRLPAAPCGRETAAWLLSSICHIPPENVTSNVPKATLFVTRIDIHHDFPHGFHIDISGHSGAGLPNAAHDLCAGSDIYYERRSTDVDA